MSPSDAPLQPAAAPLPVKEIYDAFIALCVDTRGAFETACAAAAVRGFEPFQSAYPAGGAAPRPVAEASFRRRGFAFTAEKFLAEPPGRPAHEVTSLSLVARPASYRDLSALLIADIGAPTAALPTPGVEYVFVGDPTTSPPLRTRADGRTQFERGDGDLVIITAWEVREHPARPGDAVAMSYQRSGR